MGNGEIMSVIRMKRRTTWNCDWSLKRKRKGEEHIGKENKENREEDYYACDLWVV